MLEGKIIKALSGFYDVKTAKGEVFECRGRGVFRKRKITPLVGDDVKFTIDERNKGYIKEIGPRKNELSRPPISNIDQAIIVSSAAEPDFSQLLLDRFLVSVAKNHIDAIILISKIDLVDEGLYQELLEIKRLYESIGYPTLFVSTEDPQTMKAVHPFLKHKISVIAGQSGVGKSSILNSLDESLQIDTGEISKTLGRGRHTTRHVELLNVSEGLVADTPGFSSLEFTSLEATELAACFPEMDRLSSQCRFRGCLHDQEPHCAVKKALEMNEINPKRYEHYLKFLTEIQNRKPRY